MADEKQTSIVRPIDPSRNAEDVMGETPQSGATTGSTQATSATSSDVPKDDTQIRGGVVSNTKGGMSQHISPAQYSDDAYNKQVLAGISGARKQILNDIASEKEKDEPQQQLPNNVTGESEELRAMGNATQEDAERDIRISEAPFTGEENIGQQDAVGGSESAPESMVDVGEALERTGMGVDKDGEDPQEVSFDAIDKAEDEHLHN